MQDPTSKRTANPRTKVAGSLALTLLLSSLSIVAGCSRLPDSTTPSSNQAPLNASSLFGRQARITYPQFVADVSYVSPTELHWKTTAPDGAVAEGREALAYERLSDSQHFLSWIEQDGFTVSQVIDTERLSVVAFGSYADGQSARGHRAGSLLKGTIAFRDALAPASLSPTTRAIPQGTAASETSRRAF
jgi:hypothetical protein